LGRDGHGDPLVGTLGVVVVNPGVHRLLGQGQRWEAPPGQQLSSEGLVEAFDLAGGGRAADPGAPVGDAAFAADAIEQDFAGVGAEGPVKTLPLSVRSSSGLP
jgi:hypothetical protein